MTLKVNEEQNSLGVATESPRPAQECRLRSIDELPCRPILQTAVSADAWVRVQFFREGPITKEMIFRTMELLEMMHNGWS